MDPDPLTYIGIILGSLILTVFTASEVAISASDRRQLSDRAAAGDGRARLALDMHDNASHLLLATGMMQSLGMLIAAAAITVILLPQDNLVSLGWSLLIVWIFMAVLRSVVRARVLHAPAEFSIQLAFITKVAVSILRPLTGLLQFASHAILKEEHQPIQENVLLSQDGLRILINSNKEENEVQEAEKQMIKRIFELENKVAREVMVPRIDMITLSCNEALTHALDVIIHGGHSRIPIYAENIDDIVGILYAKDLLQCFRDQRHDVEVRELLRPAHFIPASKKINVLFREMQTQKVHIAIVIDEHGGTAGLVTIEDLLEEIVGEIEDEYDSVQESLAQSIRPQAYLLNSRLGTTELEDLLQIDLDDINADTVGGLIFTLLGQLPEPGQTINYCGWSFTVLSIDGRRIEQIRAEKMVPASGEAQSPAADVASQGILGTNAT